MKLHHQPSPSAAAFHNNMDYYYNCSSSDDLEPRDVVAGEPPESIVSLLSDDLLDQNSILTPLTSSFNMKSHDDDLSGSPTLSAADDLYEEVPFSSDLDIKEQFIDCPDEATTMMLLPPNDEDYIYNSESNVTVYVDEVRCPSGNSFAATSSDDDQELTQSPPSIAIQSNHEEKTSMKKPRMSYAQLIAEALLNAADRRLTLNDIYVRINAIHPFYNLKAAKGWQNAIRHNLTLNKSFIKVPRPSNEGRGCYWQLVAGAEKNIFKRFIRQQQQQRVVSDGQKKNLCSSPPRSKPSPERRSPQKQQIKIIKTVQSSVPKLTAAVTSSSATKPTIIYVTLPKTLLKK